MDPKHRPRPTVPPHTSARRGLFLLVAAAGLAVSPQTMRCAIASPGSPAMNSQPVDEKKRQEDEKNRLLKQIQEGRSKLGPEDRRAQPGSAPPPSYKPPVPGNPGKPGASQPPSPISMPSQPANGRTSGAGNGKGGNIPAPIPPSSVPSSPAGAEAAPAAELPDPGTANRGDGTFDFDFTGETELPLLVQFVQQALGLQMMVQDGAALVGQKITLMTPITIPIKEVIPFVTMLLEQHDYTIIRNQMGIYMVLPKAQIGAGFGTDPSNTTQVIPTPGLKPSSLQNYIAALIAANKGGGGASQPAFMDDLGLIVMTDTPNVTRIVREFVNLLVEEQKKIGYTRFPINQIAASSARDRILELLGSGGGAGGGAFRALPGVPGNPGALGGGLGGSITNLAERITLDPTANALLFRGRPDETALLLSLLPLVDAPSQMIPKWYPIGNRAAELVTDEAKRQQLGEVTTFESTDSGNRSGGNGGVLGGGRNPNRPAAQNIQPQGLAGFGAQQADGSGSGFVLYPEAGGFMYRGTAQQHAKVQEIITALGPLSEINDEVVIEFYKLKHSKAADVNDVVTALISNQAASGNRGGLFGSSLGNNSPRSRTREPSATDRTRNIERRLTGEPDPAQSQRLAGGGLGAAGATGIGDIAGEDVSVTPDENNNQLVVKAPKRIQTQIKNLIERLDLRRPQVFIEAKVVAITQGDDFHLGVEVQQIIGQYALTTNFGLSTLADAGDILTRKTVPPATGLTTALIRSKDVPFIVDALARNTDARVVATPQLLVDDNQEAEIESKDAQPTTQTSIGSAGQQNTQSFGGFEEAGPRLKVKPQISEGGYMRLEYEIELSSFTGEGSNGVPPPKQTNKLNSESVTVPSDTTIVVGGLNQEFRSKNVSGIPLLKDIPIIGELFKDTRIQNRNVTLYVFITPKIMRDPSFADLRLITRKPAASAGIDSDIPRPEIQRIDLVDGARYDTEMKLEGAIKEQKPRYDPDPVIDRKKYRRRNQGMID